MKINFLQGDELLWIVPHSLQVLLSLLRITQFAKDYLSLHNDVFALKTSRYQTDKISTEDFKKTKLSIADLILTKPLLPRIFFSSFDDLFQHFNIIPGNSIHSQNDNTKKIT